MAVDGGDVVGEESSGPGDVDGVRVLPVGNQVDEFRVQRDVAIVAELADRDVQRVMVADLDDRVCRQVAELADAHPGARQEQHAELAERVGFGLGVVHERRHLVVVQELRERLGSGRDIAVDDRVAARCVVELPVDDAVEEHLHEPEALADCVRCQRLTGREVDVGDALEFERLDVAAADIASASDRRVVNDHPEPEPDERVIHCQDRRRGQRDGLLGDVAAHRACKQRCLDREPIPRGRLRCRRNDGWFGGHDVASLVVIASTSRANRLASIASDARMYSSASQSLERCR